MSRHVRMALTYLALFVFSLFALEPIVRALHEAGILEGGVPPRLGNMELHDARILGSSSLEALAIAIAGVTFASVIGFACSRRLARSRILPQIVPALILLGPLVFFLFKNNLLESTLWIGLAYLLTAAPVFSYQLKKTYDAISPSVEEAAAIDGCGNWRIFYFVLLPAVAPALVITAVFSFILAWNDYFVLAIVPPSPVWPSYSLGFLFAALLVSLCLWLVARRRVVVAS